MTFRPSQRGKETLTLSWWAQLSWPNGPGEVWTTSNSPTFGDERGLTAWIREHKGTAEVRMMRREATLGGFKDIALVADDEEFPTDLERLKAILAPLRAKLDIKAVQHRTRVAVPKGSRLPEERLRAQALATVERAQQERAHPERHSDFDPRTPQLTYDEVYTEDGTPRPEHEAAVREYARRWPAT